jgi:DNA-binding MarR family transcriptional regulator
MTQHADPPRAFLDSYLLYLLARASAAASGQFHGELAALGVPVLTWRVLAVLSDGPASVGELARAVLEKQTTLSKALDRLERDGLVVRVKSRQDRRRVAVELRPKGRDLVDRLLPMARTHQADLLRSMPPDRQQALVAALREVLFLAEPPAEADGADPAPSVIAAARPPARS